MSVSPSDPIRQIERLRRILDVSRGMAATVDLDSLLTMIINAARDVLDCERGTVFLYDAKTRELYSKVATGVDEIRFPADAGIAGSAAQSRRIVNVPDAYADSRFNRDVDKQTGFRTHSILSIPLENLEEQLIGVLQVLNKRGGAFDESDEDLAATLGAQAGVALHRGRLLEEYAEKQRISRDLHIARTIQQAYLPKAAPQLEGYEIAAWNRSADETGGDCYDFIPMCDGRLAVFFADATGHGIGAALIVAQCRSLLRALLSVSTDIADIAARVNDLLEQDISEGRFVTAFIGAIDSAAHRIDYVSAGQAPLLIYRDGEVETRQATALPLAVMPDEDFEQASIEMSPGTLFVLLTDGFYEAPDPNGALFGDDRVVNMIKQHASAPVPDLITGLYERVLAFSQNARQADDLTAVLIRRVVGTSV